MKFLVNRARALSQHYTPVMLAFKLMNERKAHYQ